MTVKRNLMPSIKRLAEFLGFLLVQANYSLGFELSFKFYGAICCGNVARSVKCRPNVDYWQSCITGISLASQVKINSPSCTFFLVSRKPPAHNLWQLAGEEAWQIFMAGGHLVRCSHHRIPVYDSLLETTRPWIQQETMEQADRYFLSEFSV